MLPVWPWRKTPQRYLDFPKLVIEKKNLPQTERIMVVVVPLGARVVLPG